ncbi:uncharacterized protein LOC132933394 [Metopolophium dirhodum]|uniref:uncharacterized protein LOC132933394 n=1 Tax=Metopolophium dirhodum TaxID=44670 RepID=UPI00298F7177|nr:uncharacterized protein LOC132933394 [Metopolophium dirhodum]
MIFVVQNSVHKCSENHLKEDTAAGIEVNKYKLIKSKDDEPNINNSLKTVNKKLPKNTNSLEISDFNDVSAENYKKSEEEGVAKIDMPKLIELIEPCAPLWNFKLSLSEGSDTIKSNLWNSIYVNFNGKYSIPALKKSWEYLKEKYTREKKIAPSGSASIKREWPHLKSLQFLDDVVLCQKREEFDIDEPSKRKKSMYYML